MVEIEMIKEEDDYTIAFHRLDGTIHYRYDCNSSYMIFKWWDTDAVARLLVKRAEKCLYPVLGNYTKIKRIPKHNNIYKDDVEHFITYAYPEILKYLKDNGYKKLRKKDFNKSTLEKCDINYLLELYSKIK